MNCDYTDPGGTPLERLTQQQAGNHPAPCARSCEANAYEIQIRQLSSERDAMAAKLAELEGQEPVAWQHRNGTLSCRCPEGQAGAYWVPLYARPSPAEPVEMSPDFTDTARSALLWVLWHHQGGSSPVGQPIRQALGMDAHERLSERQVQEAKKWAAISGAKTNDFHRSEPVNARLLEALQGLLLFPNNPRENRKARAAIAAAESQQDEPVNARLLTALKACRSEFAHYVAHYFGKGEVHKAAANVTMVAMADVAIMAAEAAPRVARLTHPDIAKALASAGLKPEDYREDGEIFPLVVAIESAALRKNGLALED